MLKKAIGQLFDVDRSVATKHLKNIFENGELSKDSVCANFAQVADNGKTDFYATAVDYSLDSLITRDFFATVQNKMHYAVHGNTAIEVIMARAVSDHPRPTLSKRL
jgi:hypothetical protein